METKVSVIRTDGLDDDVGEPEALDGRQLDADDGVREQWQLTRHDWTRAGGRAHVSAFVSWSFQMPRQHAPK